MAFSELSVERAKAAEQLLVDAYHAALDAGNPTKAAGISIVQSVVYGYLEPRGQSGSEALPTDAIL